MGRGTQGKQDGHYGDFHVLALQGLSGRERLAHPALLFTLLLGSSGS